MIKTYDENNAALPKFLRPSPKVVSRIDELLFEHLSTTDSLLKSFKGDTNIKGVNEHYDTIRLEEAFQGWDLINGPLIYDSLRFGLQSLFISPPELNVPKTNGSKLTRQSPTNRSVAQSTVGPSPHLESDDLNRSQTGAYIGNQEAARVALVCIHALASHISTPAANQEFRIPNNQEAWRSRVSLSSESIVSHRDRAWTLSHDGFEYDPALRLASRLVRAIAARRCFCEVRRATGLVQKDRVKSEEFSQILLTHLIQVETERRVTRPKPATSPPGSGESTDSDSNSRSALAPDHCAKSVSLILLGWLQTLIHQNWDGNVELKRWDVVGGAIEIIADLCRLLLGVPVFFTNFF